MLAQLRAPYPAPRAGRSSVLNGVFMGLFVALFLLYFRPFGLAGEPYASQPLLVAFFGLITLFSDWLLETVLPLLFPSWFRDAHWRVWHQIVFYLLLLLLIATLNGSFINYVQRLDFSWRNYGLIIGQTIAVGLLMVTMIVLYRYNAKNAFYLERAVELDEHSRTKAAKLNDSPGQHAAGQLLAAEAFGNYVKLYYAAGATYRQEVERTTLQQLVAERSEAGLLRCHRSFAVMTDQVRRVRGNAQGLKLSVGESGLEVPVSRSYLAAVRAALA